MAKRTDIKKILIIGSGPIVIGQAAEFDYAGTQACLALKEEGYEVVLCNSNPATIMTDTAIADKVYMEPLTLEYIAKIIRYERPDAIVPGIGGQTGLNLAMQLEKKGVLRECNVQLLGTLPPPPLSGPRTGSSLRSCASPSASPSFPPKSPTPWKRPSRPQRTSATPWYCVPAFTLGGTGGGFAYNEAELEEIGLNAFKLSPVHQVLVEKSVKGYKEIEFEVMRDSNDHAITICGMENIDPVGVHTGDSPGGGPHYDPFRPRPENAQRLRHQDHPGAENRGRLQRPVCSEPPALPNTTSLRSTPRVSRSSALASKASGYPIARVTAKIAVGMALEDIKIANTTAAFEPSLDYVVAKLPPVPL